MQETIKRTLYRPVNWFVGDGNYSKKSSHCVGALMSGSEVFLMKIAQGIIRAAGIPTREFIVFVSSIAVCSIFLPPLILHISTYGSWVEDRPPADLFVKAAREQGAAQPQAKGRDDFQSSGSRPSSILKGLPGKSHRGSTVDQVFIKASSIYWGDVRDLTKPEVFYSHKIRLTSPKQPKIVTGEEALKEIKNELRQALRKFEKSHNVKIVWDEHYKNCPDVTAAFVDFFDKGYHQTVEGRLPVESRPPVDDRLPGNASPLPKPFREEQ